MVGVAQLVPLDAPCFDVVEEAPRDDHGVGADVHDNDDEEEDLGELHVDDELDSPNWRHHLLCQVCVVVDGGRLVVALVVALIGALIPLLDDDVLLALLVVWKRNHRHSLTLRRVRRRYVVGRTSIFNHGGIIASWSTRMTILTKRRTVA